MTQTQNGTPAPRVFHFTRPGIISSSVNSTAAVYTLKYIVIAIVLILLIPVLEGKYHILANMLLIVYQVQRFDPWLTVPYTNTSIISPKETRVPPPKDSSSTALGGSVAPVCTLVWINIKRSFYSWAQTGIYSIFGLCTRGLHYTTGTTGICRREPDREFHRSTLLLALLSVGNPYPTRKEPIPFGTLLPLGGAEIQLAATKTPRSHATLSTTIGVSTRMAVERTEQHYN